MLGNRTAAALALLAVCGGITMSVNLFVMDSRAGHIGEISTNDRPTAETPRSIAGPIDPDIAPPAAVLATIVTAPPSVPDAVSNLVSISGDD